MCCEVLGQDFANTMNLTVTESNLPCTFGSLVLSETVPAPKSQSCGASNPFSSGQAASRLWTGRDAYFGMQPILVVGLYEFQTRCPKAGYRRRLRLFRSSMQLQLSFQNVCQAQCIMMPKGSKQCTKVSPIRLLPLSVCFQQKTAATPENHRMNATNNRAAKKDLRSHTFRQT